MKSVVCCTPKTMSGNVYVIFGLWNCGPTSSHWILVCSYMSWCDFDLYTSWTLNFLLFESCQTHYEHQSMAKPHWQDPVGLETINIIIKKIIPQWMNRLHAVQLKLISAILDGQDILCCTATGDGKSAAFSRRGVQSLHPTFHNPTDSVAASLVCGMDKKRHTHTEMRWDTCDEEQHTCPRFDTLMANVSHLFRNMCQILSTWYHTISINSATMFPFWIVTAEFSYTVHTLHKNSVVKSKSAFPCSSKIWDYKLYSLNYYTSSDM